jgi:hypothetical protein
MGTQSTPIFIYKIALKYKITIFDFLKLLKSIFVGLGELIQKIYNLYGL